MTDRLDVAPVARRQLRTMDPPALRRIQAAIEVLAAHPRPSGAKKLVGGGGEWRVRNRGLPHRLRDPRRRPPRPRGGYRASPGHLPKPLRAALASAFISFKSYDSVRCPVHRCHNSHTPRPSTQLIQRRTDRQQPALKECSAASEATGATRSAESQEGPPRPGRCAAYARAGRPECRRPRQYRASGFAAGPRRAGVPEAVVAVGHWAADTRGAGHPDPAGRGPHQRHRPPQDRPASPPSRRVHDAATTHDA